MPKGVYKHKVQQGFQKGHKIGIGNKNTTGFIFSNISKQKMSKASKGKKKSEIHKQNISKARIGVKNPMWKKVPWNKNKSGFVGFWRNKKRPEISGEKSHLWKGGISKVNKTERQLVMQTIEYKFWRKSCFERDNFTCQKTGINGGKLVVHHINNFADFPELRVAIDNGITLCEKCHKEFHKIYGKRNNTREQLEEFLEI
jgi:hypothetical protein